MDLLVRVNEAEGMLLFSTSIRFAPGMEWSPDVPARSPAEEVQEGRAGTETEQADAGRRNHPRRPGVRRRMRMSFDLNEPVFDEQGTYLEEPALRYEHALMEQFSASP